jgi:hypothetical protein
MTEATAFPPEVPSPRALIHIRVGTSLYRPPSGERDPARQPPDQPPEPELPTAAALIRIELRPWTGE